jgi:hypothetical protein
VHVAYNLSGKHHQGIMTYETYESTSMPKKLKEDKELMEYIGEPIVN